MRSITHVQYCFKDLDWTQTALSYALAMDVSWVRLGKYRAPNRWLSDLECLAKGFLIFVQRAESTFNQ